MTPPTCGPGATCTLDGSGFFVIGTVSGASVRWDFTSTQPSLPPSDTGANPDSRRDLWYVTQLDVYDLIAGETVTLSASGTSMPENGGTITITATRSITSSSATYVTIDLCTPTHGPFACADAGMATLDNDFTQNGSALADGTLQRNVYTFAIPANQASGSMTLTSINDGDVEVDETITFYIYRVSSGLKNATPITVSIDDDDRKVTLGVDKSSIPETGGSATVTAYLSPVNTAEAVAVSLGFTGTATLSSDYTRSGTSITIPAGAASASATINAVSDAISEPDETVIIDITGVTNASESGTQQQTITILDDDLPQVSLEIAGSPLVENNTGISTVTARLDKVCWQPVAVNLAFTGTATSGTDYSPSAASITIPINNLTGSMTITGLPDTIDEPNETVIVDVTGIVGASAGSTQQVTATITDDDNPPTVTLSLAPASLAENGGTATVTATLSGVSAFDVTVDLGFTGTAGLPDYTRSASSISIPAGSLSGSVTLTGVDDALDEPDETVIVDITGATNATESGTQQVTATITDDDPTPTVTLTVENSPFAEAAGSATVRATLSAASGYPVTVDLGFAGAATNSTDYIRSAESITIAPGSLSGTVTLIAVDDTIDEPDETVIVDVIGVTNGTESGTQQVTATIADDDVSTVALSLAGSPLAEAGGVATVTATLSTPSTSSVTVHLGFGGTAEAADYTASATSITIAAGATTGSITLTANDDSLYESDESVTVDITSVSGGAQEDTSTGQQQVIATISDDEAPPTVTLSMTGSPLAESGGVATVKVLLSGVSALPVTVTLGLTGTATHPDDYTTTPAMPPAPITLMIPPLATEGTVTLTAVSDALYELDEMVIVDITSVTNGTESGTQQVIATITDDDAPPTVTLSITGSPLAESGGIATVKAILSEASGLPVTVTFGLSGTATDPADYTTTPPAPIALVIPAGATEGTLTLTAVADVIDEIDETVIVDITNVANGIESGTQQVTATIADDDAPPMVMLSLAGSPLAETGGIATVKALLSGPSALPVTVTLGLTGTATHPDDFTTAPAMPPMPIALVIPAGLTEGTLTLTAAADILDEIDETVIVDITGVTNATESGTQQVTATIADDDAPPTVTLSITGSPLAETGGVATVKALLSGVSALPVTVTLGLSGTATHPDDYTTAPAIPPTLVIPAGTTEGTLTLTSAPDTLDELDETVIVDITSVTNATQMGTQQVTATITDDDAPPTVTLSLAGSPLAETGGVATVKALLSGPSALPVTVTFGLTGTATDPADYTTTPAMPIALVIPAGATEGTLTLTAVADALDEIDETVIVDITGVTNGTEAGTQQVTATIADDDAPPTVTLSLAGSPLAETGGIATVKALLSGPSALPVTVTLGLTGTASYPDDYTSAPAMPAALVIPAGATEGTLTLTAVSDAIDEPDDSVIVDITGVTNGTESGTQQVTATIADDDAPPTVTLSIAGSPLAESGGVATVKALLSGPSALPVTVNLGLTGTATYADDFTTTPPIPIALLIPAGATEGTVTLTAAPDTLDEFDETVIVDIASVTNATESGTQQVTATIADDDAAPTVTLSLAGTPLAETGGTATVTASLSQLSSLPVTVDLALGGTASGTDYTASATSIVIASGSTSGSVTLTAVDDTTPELDETVLVDIAGVTNAIESGTQQVTATITDDDPARLAFATQPSTTVAGQTMSSVTIQVLDSSARLVPASTASVTLAIGTNPASGNLTGTLTVAAVGGVATFSDLAIDAYGSGYTLVASSSGLAGATSSPFEITPNAVTTFWGPSVTGTGIVNVSFAGGGPACTFVDASLLGQPPGTDPLPPTSPLGLVFPHGLFRFEIGACAPGAEVTFTITYPELLPEGTRYWKYGPPTAGAQAVWYELPATIKGNIVTFTIVDGGLGDSDGLANGTLRDPGGPAFATAVAIPTLPVWALWLTALVLLGLGLLQIRSSSGT